MDFKDLLTSIDPSKKSLKFLADRILSDNYRGSHISQHFRYNMDDIIVILQILYEIAGTGLLRIRTTDNSKRPSNIPEEKGYAILVHEIKKKISKCGQDSLRKNMFPDMHRMGLINRYDENKQKKGPYDKGIKQYISLTDVGKKIIDPNLKYFDKYALYTEAINKLTHDLPTTILDIIIENGYVYEDEFMFFLTFIGEELNSVYYTKDMINDLLKDYRSLQRIQKIEVNRIVKNYCNPKNFIGNKTNKRDYHNWKNETQQIFTLLSQTIYYSFDNNNQRLSPRIDQRLLFESSNKLLRSLEEKKEYFKNHNVNKTLGFELHHIVPLSYAMSKEEFKIIDNWKNMVYIDGKTHSIITQQNNSHIKLDFSNNNIILSQPYGQSLNCILNQNVIYNPINKEKMIDYNNHLLSGKII